MVCSYCRRVHTQSLRVALRDFQMPDGLVSFDLYVGSSDETYPGVPGVSMWASEVNFLITRDYLDADVIHKADATGIARAIRNFNEYGYLVICSTNLYYIRLVRSPKNHVSFNWTNTQGIQRGYYEKAHVPDMRLFLKKLKWCITYGSVYRSLASV